MLGNFRKSLMISAAIIIGSLTVFGAAAYFLTGIMSAEAQKISADRTTIRNNSDLIEGLAKQKASSPEVQKYERAINLILPPKDDLVNFSSWLDGLSRAHQVNVSFYFNGDAVPPDKTSAGYIKFVMSVGGDYTSVTDFLRDVEVKDSKYTVSFDDFDLKRNDTNYSVNLTGKVFFR